MDENLPVGLNLDVVLEIVLLRRDGGGPIVAVEGADPVDLHGDEPTGDLLAQLVDSTVRLSLAEGVPAEVIDVLSGVPVPRAFQMSPWLRDSRSVVLADGGCRIGPLVLRYTDRAGLEFDSSLGTAGRERMSS